MEQEHLFSFPKKINISSFLIILVVFLLKNSLFIFIIITKKQQITDFKGIYLLSLFVC